MNKNAVELVQNQRSVFFQPAFLGTKAQQQVETYISPEQSEPIPQEQEDRTTLLTLRAEGSQLPHVARVGITPMNILIRGQRKGRIYQLGSLLARGQNKKAKGRSTTYSSQPAPRPAACKRQ